MSKHDATPVYGDSLTLERVTAMAGITDWDVIVISGHYDINHSAYRFNGFSLDKSSIASLSKRARCVYLNGCGTSMIAKYILQSGVEHVISNGGSPDETTDQRCWELSSAFFGELHRTGDILKSYRFAEDANGILQYLVEPEEDEFKSLVKRQMSAQARVSERHCVRMKQLAWGFGVQSVLNLTTLGIVLSQLR